MQLYRAECRNVWLASTVSAVTPRFQSCVEILRIDVEMMIAVLLLLTVKSGKKIIYQLSFKIT